jgi:hypothetical protein
MKQFQKYGVAAAVASMAAGAVATEVSRSEVGDLAIVPYYTVNNGFNTGVHIINTSDATQVVKFRLRRGADSKDALDFNLVMSPRDEWTGNITAGGDNGVIVETNDTTCTVPEFPAGGAPMPSTFAKGATEGYIEIIAMAAADKTQPISIAAKHAKGVPADCDAVRNNFFRVDADDAGKPAVKGVHFSNASSNGALSAAAASAGQNISLYTDSVNPLKVSFMITDSEGGLEFGDNAVMVEDFAAAAMMTNQQALSFGTNGLLNFDALNFELPNLSRGALLEDVSASDTDNRAEKKGSFSLLRGKGVSVSVTPEMAETELYNDLRQALDADKIINEWASIETDAATVATDWVVTLPGQYTMTNPVCGIYAAYDEATAGGCTSTALKLADKDELPLTLASNASGDPAGSGSKMLLWDREETALNGKESAASGELGFSPGGSSGDPDKTATLKREVNVISFNGTSVLGTAAAQKATAGDMGLGVTVTVEGADRGWAQLEIVPTAGAAVFNMSGVDGADVKPNSATAGAAAAAALNGSYTAVAADRTAVVGMAVWERQFSGQAGNYGRAIEHTTLTSSGAIVGNFTQRSS